MTRRRLAGMLFLAAILVLAGATPVGLAGAAADPWRFQDDDDDGGVDDDDFVVAPPPAVDDGRGQRSGVIVDDDGDPSTDGYYAGEVMVRLVAGASVDGFNQRHGTRTIAAIDGRDLYLLQLPAAADPARIGDDLGRDDELIWAELNYVSQAPEGRPQYFFTSGGPAEADPEGQYALELLGVEAALDCTNGDGVVVAVLDTGVDATHQALRGRVLSRGINALTGTNDTLDGGNGWDDDGDGMVDEMAGHGTHVAGIIAQVAPGAIVLPITVLNSDGVGDAFFLAAGIYQAVDRGAEVINLSLSSTFDAQIVAEAVVVAADQGIPVIAAAGNAGREEPLEYPAAAPQALGVAATDAEDRRSDFSNFGEAVAISAPGEAIVSALPGDRHGAWGGTSMATAFVSGAAALVLDGAGDLAGHEVSEHLAETAEDISTQNPGYEEKLGAGRLDLAAAGCA